MAVVKLTLKDEEVMELRQLAANEGVNVQEYIKQKVFNRKNIFTPSEVVKRALEKFSTGDLFTVPQCYTTEEWSHMTRGNAGVLGREFRVLVETQYATKIRFNDYVNSGRHAQYEIL